MRGDKDKLMKSGAICKQSTLRYTGLAVIALIGIFAIIRLFSSDSSSVSATAAASSLVEQAASAVGYAPDRALAYNVKVIPASLDDAALNQLPKDTFSFLAMIDAGSSGCRAHIYRYGKLGSITGPLYVLPEHESMKVRPGLSSFAESPQDAGASLKGLVDFIKSQVPESDWATTPIWLKATAGLRMLPAQQSEAVLQSVRAFLGSSDNSPFLFRASWAKVIPGNEEGGFGWIAFNYLKKLIGPKRQQQQQQQQQQQSGGGGGGMGSLEAAAASTYAVVEMGGASAQVSQLAPSEAEAAKIPAEYKFEFTIEKEKYVLYTHSYLGFGAEQGRQQLNKLVLASSSSPSTAAASAVANNAAVTAAVTTAVLSDPCINSGYQRDAATAPAEPYEGPAGAAVRGAAQGAQQCSNTLQSLFDHNTSSSSSSGGSSSSSSDTSSCTKSTAAAVAAGPFTFDCVYQPNFVTQSKNFLIFENFYYMSSALGVKPASESAIKATLGPTAAAIAAANTSSGSSNAFPLLTTPRNILEATQSFCSRSWSAVQAEFPLDSQPKDVLTKMCFVGAYSYEFLVHGLHLSPDKVLTVQKDVGSSEIEWALGAAYKETADLLKRTNLRPT